jgi:hypothetical protein
MQYKTIILEMLEQRPELHEQLRQQRKLLATTELYAADLKESHESWTTILSQEDPVREKRQVSSEVLELALKELEGRLPPASAPDDQTELSLDGAMAFIRRHTRRG